MTAPVTPTQEVRTLGGGNGMQGPKGSFIIIEGQRAMQAASRCRASHDFFFFLALLCGLWDLSSPTRD